MSMNHDLPARSRITTPRARLEWTTMGSEDIYLLYDHADYRQSSTSDGWWHRTLALDAYNVLSLSGTADSSPWEALRTILHHPNRPPIALPALVVAMFLTRAANPDTWEQRYLLRWVLASIPEWYTSIPAGSFHAGWDEVSDTAQHHFLHLFINVLLQFDPQVPWVLPDGVWFQALDQLGEFLWSFLLYPTRMITADAARHLEQVGHANDDSARTSGYTEDTARWSVIGNLSAIRFWREPWPTLRGLPIQSSILDFLQIWKQALVIMHPDAPPISDTQFSWLCDGRIGAPDDGPFDSLVVASPNIDGLGHSVTEWQKQIVMFKQEAARGTCRPSGCWAVAVSSEWPVLSAYGVATMQIVSGPKGYWVRLIPAGTSWGSVVWWLPEKRPLTSLALALGKALDSVQVLALHATLWQIWRHLRVEGRPTSEAQHVTP